ncbi:MAG TPA: hypothetical protein VF945_08300 [Polyangia bacterium]
MNTRTFLASFFGLALVAGGCAAPDDGSLEAQAALNGAPEPAPPGAHGFLQRGEAKSGGAPAGDMTYHGGNVLIANKALAIFWGSEWTTDTSDKIPGVDSFFSGLDSSNFAGTSDEYTDASGAHVTSSTTYLGHTIDSSAAPRRAINTSTAVNEACTITNNNPDPNAIYFLFTSTGAGHVNYCAWHSWGTCSNGALVQVAYMPNIDGIAGCDPQDTWTTHSQGLSALANVTSHEWSEARTDPRGSGWFDSGNAENGDKCAWSFHGPVTLKNGSTWKLQMEWSNAAFDASSGYANRSGQLGCLQGQ